MLDKERFSFEKEKLPDQWAKAAKRGSSHPALGRSTADTSNDVASVGCRMGCAPGASVAEQRWGPQVASPMLRVPPLSPRWGRVFEVPTVLSVNNMGHLEAGSN